MVVEIGFCDDDGRGFELVQPTHHIERWTLPHDNGSHLVVHWRPTKWVCGLNVTAYHVAVKTSSPVLNRFVTIFGKMPQDVCAPDSIARGSVAVDDVSQAGGPSACSPYLCDKETYTSAVAIPLVLRTLANWDVVVSIRAYGTVAPVAASDQSQRRDVQFWCHKYRRAPPELTQRASSGSGAPRGPRRRWLAWLRPRRGATADIQLPDTGATAGIPESDPVELTQALCRSICLAMLLAVLGYHTRARLWRCAARVSGSQQRPVEEQTKQD